LVVMLADTDAGCLITAGQSGAQWGYALVPLQIILVPIVFMAQELTIRLGLYTNQGQSELIQRYYGSFWAWLVAILIVLNCTGAVICEMTAVVGIGTLYSIPKWISTSICLFFLFSIVLTGSYQRVEKLCVLIGLFELVFIVTMIMTAPDFQTFKNGLSFPIQNSGFLYLVAANIGAVVMPWMIYYQQSAIASKGLTVSDLPYARADTAVGSVLTQLIMVAVMITTAGSIWDGHLPSNASLNTVEDFSHALTPHLGVIAGRTLFSLGLLGGAMIGAVVVTLTATWALGEVAGFKRSLESNPAEAPWFYVVYFCILVLGAAVCLSPLNVVTLNVGIQVFNATLLPMVLIFLFLLSSSVDILPVEVRLTGWYKYFVAVTFIICSAVGLVTGGYGIFSPSESGEQMHSHH